MKIPLVGGGGKHLFEKVVDTEQVFVMGCRHDEHPFDERGGPGTGAVGVTPATYNGDDGDDRKVLPMTALLTASLPEYLDDDQPREYSRPARPELRLVRDPARHGAARPDDCDGGRPDAHRVHPRRRRASVEVRRRRTILASMGLALTLLALPLGGFGGASHTAESAFAAQGRPSTYVVQPGDSLWSIAERMDPSGDPRPIVSQLAAELGTYEVVPGEQITLP